MTTTGTYPGMTEQHGTVEVGSVIRRLDATPVPDLAREEIDRQIATARAYPRDLDDFRRRARRMLERHPELAEEAFYSLERKDRRTGTRNAIEGPSIRLAEIVAHTYGNLRSDGGVTSEDPRYVTVWAAAWDLETNVAHRVQIRRPIVGRSGSRYSDEMVGVTTNAAMSIARRNAIFAVVPKPLWVDLYEYARELATGSDIGARVAKAVAWFADQDVGVAQLLDWLAVEATDEIGRPELERLLGLAQAIRQGEQSVKEVFGA